MSAEMPTHPACATTGWTILSYHSEDPRNVIEAEANDRTQSCPGCGQREAHIGYGHRRKSIVDIPWDGRPTTISLACRRLLCRGCGLVFTAPPPAVDSYHRITDRGTAHIRHLFALGMNKAEISRMFGVDDTTIGDVLRSNKGQADMAATKEEFP